MNKSVRVTSNDPRNKLKTLRVTATVKVDTGDEEFSLNLGNVRRNAQFVKDVYIPVDKMVRYEVTQVESSSPLITAREIVPEDSTAKPDSLHFQIVIDPGLDIGLMSEKVVIHFKDDIRARANYFLYGIVVDDIEVAPLRLSYVVSGTEIDIPNSTRKLILTNYYKELPLEIIDIQTPGGNLDFTVKEVKKGEEYQIMAAANDKMLAVDSTLDSRIVITTNNPDMRQIKIPFQVVRR